MLALKNSTEVNYHLLSTIPTNIHIYKSTDTVDDQDEMKTTLMSFKIYWNPKNYLHRYLDKTWITNNIATKRGSASTFQWYKVCDLEADVTCY